MGPTPPKLRQRSSARPSTFEASAWRKAALAAVAAKVGLVVLVVVPGAHDAFALPKSAASYGASFVLLALLAILARRFGRELWHPSPLHAAVVAYACANALATAFAVQPFVAAFGAPVHFLGLTAALDGLVLYVAVAVVVRREREALLLLVAVLLTVLPVMGYLAVQRAGLDPLRWVDGGIAFSTLANANVLGGYLAAVAVAGVALLALFWRDLRLSFRAAAAGFVGLTLFAVLQTGTRAAVLGIAAGSIALAALSLRAGLRPSRRAVAALGLGAVALAAAAVVFGASTPLIGRLAAPADASVRERVVIWRAALQLVAERPVLGLGPDNFVTGYPRVRDVAALATISGEDTLARSTHGLFFRVAVDVGLLGLAAYLATLVLATWLAWRGRSRVAALAFAMLAAHVGQGVVAIEHVGTEWIPWLALGLVASRPGSASEPALSPAAVRAAGPVRARRKGGLAFDVALLAVALLAAAASWQTVRASEALAQSSAALGRKDAAGALAWALEATRIDPRRSAYWHGLSLAYDALGRLKDAAAAFERAAELQPYQSDGWRNLAIAHLRLLDSDAGEHGQLARAAAERGVVAEPESPRARFILSRVALALGDDERAAAEAERALAVIARSEYAEAAGAAYVRLRRWQDAERVLTPYLDVGQSFRLLAAEVYLATGRADLARRQVEISLQADPKDPTALALLRRIEQSR